MASVWVFLALLSPYLNVKVVLCFTIIICCILVSVMGPSSALLFLPSQQWFSNGGTDFYIAGTMDQLWPQHLTVNHTGPPTCRQSPLPTLEFCPFSIMKSLLEHPQGPPEAPAWDLYLKNGAAPRLILGNSPNTRTISSSRPQVPEMWAWAVHGASLTHTNDLINRYNLAQKYATGRNKCLNRFINGGYSSQRGLIPVARTVCGPPQEIGVNTMSLPFPLLNSTEQWHKAPYRTPPTWGPLKELAIHGMQHLNFSNHVPARTKWMSLPPDFTGATAGLVHICQNESFTLARACAIDSRWAQGQTFRGSHNLVDAWSSSIGKFSELSDNVLVTERPFHFWDRAALYGKTIKAEQEWIDAISPLYGTDTDSNGFNMTVFEAVLNSSFKVLKDPSSILNDDNWARITLEYADPLLSCLVSLC